MMKADTTRSSTSSAIRVLAALAVVVALAALLVVRSMAGDDPGAAATPARDRLAHPTERTEPGAATVPPPLGLAGETLEVPCWWCPQSAKWRLRFRTDLDRLAPLGDGATNAALWFRDFARATGARSAEGDAALGRRIDHPSGLQVLPADDPLLLEAEPWVDQARMRFYPDAFPIRGWDTEIPNLLLALTFCKSWTARGHDATDDEAALADYRRAIRLGRLLRQEDAVLINDLVGLACVRYGTEGVYALAGRSEDHDLALLASIVLGEIAPQRLMTSERVTRVDLTDDIRRSWWGRVSLEIRDDDVESLIDRVEDDPDRRFRMEALLALNTVRNLGSSSQVERVTGILQAASRSDDPVTAEMARWCLEHEITAGELEQMAGH